MAALTRRLEADLQQLQLRAVPGGAAGAQAASPATSHLQGSASLGPLLQQRRSASTDVGAPSGTGTSPRRLHPEAAGSSSKLQAATSQQQTPALASQQEQQQLQQQHMSGTGTFARPALSASLSPLSGGTYATPASSLLQRSGSFEAALQEAPASTSSTAAGGAGPPRHVSGPSLSLTAAPGAASLDDAAPGDRQSSLANALQQLKSATDKGSSRWGGVGIQA